MDLPPPPPSREGDTWSAGPAPGRGQGRPRRNLLPILLGGLVALVVGAIVDRFGGEEAPVSSPTKPIHTATSTAEPSVVSSPSGATPQPSPSPAKQQRKTNPTITRVIDGDTVEVRYKGSIIDVRLIGIDTPETVALGEPVECYGPAASRFTEQHLDHKRVLLEFDVERTDQYGRTLAYVWLRDELFNQTLVARGFAQVSTFPPNVKYVDRFLEVQREARSADRGLWGSCQTEEETGGGGGGGGNCDPSYPDVCIPPYPPDLDCGEISHTNLRVTGSDPHGFDGDNDGMGCET